MVEEGAIRGIARREAILEVEEGAIRGIARREAILEVEEGAIRGIARREAILEEGATRVEEGVKGIKGLLVDQDEGQMAPAEGEGAVVRAEARGVSLTRAFFIRNILGTPWRRVPR